MLASTYLKGPARQLARQLLGHQDVASRPHVATKHKRHWNPINIQSQSIAKSSTVATQHSHVDSQATQQLASNNNSNNNNNTRTFERLDSNFHPSYLHPKGKVNRENQNNRSTRDVRIDPNRGTWGLNEEMRRENQFVYKHVHKSVEDYAPSEHTLDELPVATQINKFREYLKEHPQRSSQPELELMKLYDSIRASMSTMNQQELAILLMGTANERGREWLPIWRNIDIELRWLVKQHVRTRLMDMNLWLYLSDLYYSIGMTPKFAMVLLRYLSQEKQIEVNNRQLVHLLFLVIQRRENGGILNKYHNEIERIIDKGTFEDLVTVCMAYYKTRTFIPTKGLITKCLNRLVDFLPKIDPKEPGYCAIIKSIRYSIKNSSGSDRDLAIRLIEHLVKDKKIIFASAHNAIQSIKLMESFRIYDENLLTDAIELILRDSHKLRIKDIQYFLSSLSNLSYNNLQMNATLTEHFDKLCDDIVNQTRPDHEYSETHLLPLIRAFISFGFYNEKFINYLCEQLKEDGIKKWQEVLEYDRTLLLAYSATRIEDSPVKLIDKSPSGVEYLKMISEGLGRFGDVGVINNTKLTRLNSILNKPNGQLRDSSGRKLTWTSLFRQIGHDIAHHPEIVGHNLSVGFQFTLPHQNFADMVVSRNCLPPGNFDPETLEPQPIVEGQRHCLVFGIRHQHDCIGEDGKLSGYKQMISRLLSKIGYKVVFIDFNSHQIDETVHRIKTALQSN